MNSQALMVVGARVEVETAPLSRAAVEELKVAFSHINAHREALKRMRIPYKTEPAIISTWREDAGWLSLPRGGFTRVRDILERYGVRPIVEDFSTEGAPDLRGEVKPHRLVLYPDQEKAVSAALGAKTCLLRAPTGSGKTSCGLAMAARVNLPTLAIVPNRGLFDLWVARVQSELGMRAGVIQGPTTDVRPVTVAMQKTLYDRFESGKGEDLKDAFGVVLLDECQAAPARTFFGAVDPLSARYRIGLSADERRKDRKEFLAQDLFGEVAAEISRDALEDAGRVMDVRIDVVPTNFSADWYGMPDSGADRELDFGRLLEEMAGDHERNGLAIEHACRDLQKGEQVLVMSRRREHCRDLAALLVARNVRTGFMIGGEDYRSEFVATREGLMRGDVRAAVGTYQAIGQGIDLPRVASVVAATPIAGNRQFFQQVRGRVARVAEGKKDARLIYLWDRNVFGMKHLQNLCAWNRRVRLFVNDEWVDAGSQIKIGRRR